MKVSRPSGVLWNSSADPVVIMILLGGIEEKSGHEVLECYLRSGPERRGYRKRMHDIWRSKDIFEVTEQRLMDQILQIKKNKWRSNLEIKTIKR